MRSQHTERSATAEPPGPDMFDLPTVAPFQLAPPWDEPGTRYFWTGPYSSFAIIREGIILPAGYLGHGHGEMCTAYSRESYFQACKARDSDTFHEILAASPLVAKELGGRNGIVQLRDDWERVRYAVMLTFNRLQWHLDGWRELLLMTGEQTLAELSPYDAEWGCKNRHTGKLTGRNLLGICHMQVRQELRQETHAQFSGKRPFLFPQPAGLHRRDGVALRR